jgi:hypothetical protein
LFDFLFCRKKKKKEKKKIVAVVVWAGGKELSANDIALVHSERERDTSFIKFRDNSFVEGGVERSKFL